LWEGTAVALPLPSASRDRGTGGMPPYIFCRNLKVTKQLKIEEFAVTSSPLNAARLFIVVKQLNHRHPACCP
jgi:hypothetical protein